jgi:hypothetical protein
MALNPLGPANPGQPAFNPAPNVPALPNVQPPAAAGNVPANNLNQPPLNALPQLNPAPPQGVGQNLNVNG